MGYQPIRATNQSDRVLKLHYNEVVPSANENTKNLMLLSSTHASQDSQ